MNYHPQAHSLAGQVLAFFRANPDEELSVDDMAGKFGVNRKNIHTLLRPALDASLLARERNDEAEYIYKAGPQLQTVPAARARKNATTTPDTTGHGALFGADTAYSQALIAQLPVATDRVYDPNPSHKGQSKWQPLFHRLTQNGQSILFPAGWRKAVASHAQKVNKEAAAQPGHGHVFRITTKGEAACLWRLPK